MGTEIGAKALGDENRHRFYRRPDYTDVTYL